MTCDVCHARPAVKTWTGVLGYCNECVAHIDEFRMRHQFEPMDWMSVDLRENRDADEVCARCGHRAYDHIYHCGACRPGFICLCPEFEEAAS